MRTCEHLVANRVHTHGIGARYFACHNCTLHKQFGSELVQSPKDSPCTKFHLQNGGPELYSSSSLSWLHSASAQENIRHIGHHQSRTRWRGTDRIPSQHVRRSGGSLHCKFCRPDHQLSTGQTHIPHKHLVLDSAGILGRIRCTRHHRSYTYHCHTCRTSELQCYRSADIRRGNPNKRSRLGCTCLDTPGSRSVLQWARSHPHMDYIAPH